MIEVGFQAMLGTGTNAFSPSTAINDALPKTKDTVGEVCHSTQKGSLNFRRKLLNFCVNRGRHGLANAPGSLVSPAGQHIYWGAACVEKSVISPGAQLIPTAFETHLESSPSSF